MHTFTYISIAAVLLFGLACEQREELATAPPAPETRSDSQALRADAGGTRTDGGSARAIVAWVNEVPISSDALGAHLERVRLLYYEQRKHLTPAEEARKRDEILQALIDQELIRQHVDGQKEPVTERELSGALDRRIKRVFGSAPAFQRYLREHDQSVTEYRRELARELALERSLGRDEIAAEVDVATLRELYADVANREAAAERVRVSSLVVPRPSDLSPQEARRQLRDVLRGVGDEREFRRTARTLIGSDADVRDLGWVERGALDRTAEEAIFGDRATSTAALVETPAGHLVFWIHERDVTPTAGFDRARDDLKRLHVERELAKRRAELVRRLRSEADIRRPAD